MVEGDDSERSMGSIIASFWTTHNTPLSLANAERDISSATLGKASNNAMLCNQRHLSNPTVHQLAILAPISQAFLSFLF
jgi:hypothetical protein